VRWVELRGIIPYLPLQRDGRGTIHSEKKQKKKVRAKERDRDTVHAEPRCVWPEERGVGGG